MKIKTILLSLFAIIALSTISFAQETKPTENQDSVKKERGFGKRGERGFGGKRYGKRGKGEMVHGLGKLNLTEAQKEQMRALKERNKTQFAPQRDEIKQLIGKKRDGIITADEQNRLKELKGQMMENGRKLKEEMMSILTPEQKTQLEQMKAEKRQKMVERKEMRKGRKSETPKEN
jgi:Spy/CpxP family protein refolding chaperone